MSEFLWPPPDDELDATSAPPFRRATRRRRRGASPRHERRRRPEQATHAGFAWPPTESDFSAPASVQGPDPAVRFSAGAVRLDRGLASPPGDRTTRASRASQRWHVALRRGRRPVVMFAIAVVLAVVTGGMWQIAHRWNAVPRQRPSLDSVAAGARSGARARDMEVAPRPSRTEVPADRSPAPTRSEPEAVADATVTQREPEAQASAGASATTANERGGRQDRRAPPPTTRPSVEQRSEAAIAAAAIDAEYSRQIADRRRLASTGNMTPLSQVSGLASLTPLVEPPPPAAGSSAPVSPVTLPAEKPVADADASAPPIGESASRSPAARSRSAPVPDEDHEAIEQLVARYQAAFDERDADAAAAVWPSVDGPALARAFADVQEQDLTLERCDVAVEQAQATASCPGALSYVRRVGPPDPQVARHVWTFLLERHERGWLIAEVTAR
ncbi:MAG: hypothetical protein GEV06_27720 [Luteitalea sp.]|nr:hypothetical protein [Luteitalea sp.]